MTGGDLNNLFRIETAEPDSQGRWSDTDVYTLINEAQKFIALQIEWPIVHLSTTTVLNTQEYTMPEIIQIHRVYLAGQPCVPTDIATLEGLQIGYYDQNSTQTAYTPQWNSAVYNTYPVANTQAGYPNGVSPYYVGQRPQFYENGGNIGFVPIPAGAYALDIWGIGVPRSLAASNDVSDFPSFFQSAIAHKAAERALIADNKPAMAQIQAMKFAEWMPRLREWKHDLLKFKSRGPRPIAYRHFYRRGPILQDDN